MRFYTPLAGAAAAAAGTLALAVLSRLWRRRDAALWHGLFMVVGSTSIVFALQPAHLPAGISPHISFISALALATSALAVSPPVSDRWIAIIGWIYAAGVAWQLCRLLLGFGWVQRLRRSAYVPGEAWVRHFSFVAPEVSTPCYLHRRAQVPMTVGWLHPVIILPESALEWPADRLRAILLHEHAHVIRRDYLWNLCAAVHQAVYWFSPCAWLLTRRVQLLAELASDRDVSEIIGRRHYARQLVDAASEFSAYSRSGMFAPGGATAIVRRIHALASSGPREPSLTRAGHVTLAVLVVVAMVLGLSLRIDAAPRASEGAFPHMGAGNHDAKHAAMHRLAGH